MQYFKSFKKHITNPVNFATVSRTAGVILIQNFVDDKTYQLMVGLNLLNKTLI